MIKRWSFYLLVGGLFGIFDFYFQDWMQQIFSARMGNPMLIPILGVWLVMVIPIAIREVKASRSIWLAAAASAFAWSVSIVSYYLFMGVKLILIGQASREEMHISNHRDRFYWSNVRSFFLGDFLSGVGEWIVVALIGGCLVGLAIGLWVRRTNKAAQS
ncbi:hypothetical protein FDZ74_01970 [bacterium]|nr:MAG: hypothetical protein FDZ74_01970 [bacterium]